MTESTPLQLIDRFNRRIDYVRLSVTDRCDFRCTYCMAEEMTFLPRSKVLSLEEIARIAGVFVQLGVAKLRVTGGEPLVRRDVTTLFQELGSLLAEDGLKELESKYEKGFSVRALSDDIVSSCYHVASLCL